MPYRHEDDDTPWYLSPAVFPIAIALLLLYGLATAHGAPACQVRATPKVDVEPLRFVRANATIEADPRDVRIELGLFGPYGEVRTSLVWERGWVEHARTYQVEWGNLGEPAGDYEVILLVSRSEGACRAVDRVLVR